MFQFESHLKSLENEYGNVNASVPATIIENNIIRVEKTGGGNFNIKYPATNDEDYWTFQHYKTSDIRNLSVEDR